MRTLLLVSASCLVLGGVGARAETYVILDGTLTTIETGTTQVLTGAFDASSIDVGRLGRPELTPLLVDDFAFQSGDHTFTPNEPIEFEGLTPLLFLEVADQIILEGDDVELIHMRSGGELVGFSDDEVTFRFLDFRAGASGGGQAIGQLGDSMLPRRLQLEGTLYEVDQTLRIRRDPCILPPVELLPPGGGVIVIGGGDVVVQYDRFEIDPEETVEFVQPGGGGVVLSRVTGGGSTIEGELQVGGGVYIINPGALQLGPVGASTTPTLEELGITTPDGAIVSYDDVPALHRGEVHSLRSLGPCEIVWPPESDNQTDNTHNNHRLHLATPLVECRHQTAPPRTQLLPPSRSDGSAVASR